MKKIFLAMAVAIACISVSFAQEKETVLYGVLQPKDLAAAPCSKWFTPAYDAYIPDSAVVASLRKLDLKGVTMEVFFGTWCGDSRRELPHLFKLLQAVSFPEKNIRLVALGGDSLYKQSPQHEEAGKNIFRLPTIIVYKNGKEVNRLIEFPVYSLEKDLLCLLGSSDYSPNFKTFPVIQKWVADGTLLDNNANTRGLAMQLKWLTSGERELNSLGYLLQELGKGREALRIFQVNAILFPESANVLSGLGEAYYKTGDTNNSVQTLEKALELNKDPQQVKPILKILYAAKGAKS